MRPWFLAAVLGAALAHGAAAAEERVDLNLASAEQLQHLPGIGPKKAEAILALRQRRPFSRVSQLLEVRGIGKKTLERLKPLVWVGGAPPPGLPLASGAEQGGPSAGVAPPMGPTAEHPAQGP